VGTTVGGSVVGALVEVGTAVGGGEVGDWVWVGTTAGVSVGRGDPQAPSSSETTIRVVNRSVANPFLSLMEVYLLDLI